MFAPRECPSRIHLATVSVGLLLLSCGESTNGESRGASDAGGGAAGNRGSAGGRTASDAGGGDGGARSAGSDASGTTGGRAGNANGGAGGAGNDADANGIPHIVGKCETLAAAGKWENITPPLTVLPTNAPCPYGGAFVMNPQNPTTLYRGSCNQGIWKTTDCGATWVHINTGTNGTILDGGRQWTFVIDPVDPEVLYTNSGYGAASNGAFKSTNGGVDWQPLWPPTDPVQAKLVEYNFVGGIAMDPQDHTHLLITFHAKCAAPHPEACFGESTDAGVTWHVIDGQADWVGGEGQAVYFLEGSKIWLWGSQSNGLWRTADGGATFKAVTDKQAQGHGAGQMYRAKNGVFYLPVLNGILRSPDGIEWTIVPNSGSIMSGLTGNGTTMYASRGFPWDPSTNLYEPFWSSPENDGEHWTQLASPVLSNGGSLKYDTDRQILYSSNGGEGLWRVVTP